ncbi:hypothetical protein BT96DRAFT_1015845 [Gymnopus androsaceus JB14]|uniref:Uncharacterized protein n=1 Tax=Gymnopus androsaceus JB14 TaxID=1447944 RepID=A0A6A4I5K4_9AGAR|nr:hypothetical protein BT96DRAFT_1015845 [Gymnopus androsaceus JB14]
MSAFEPSVIISILQTLEEPSERKAFADRWQSDVTARIRSWTTNRPKSSQSTVKEQLEFEAHVAIYVNYLNAQTTSRKKKDAFRLPLPPSIPIYGPRFMPPTHLHSLRRDPSCTTLVPKTLYLKPVNVVHPFYYPQLCCCPQCGESKKIGWVGWTGQGSRDIHGINYEETALGVQLRCDTCKSRLPTEGKKKGPHCFATTSPVFWEKLEHWEIPRGVPHFLKRCAVTRELYDLIVETRISGTSAGLEEHIRQLHLLEFSKRILEYLVFFQLCPPQSLEPATLQMFSARSNELEYNDHSISDEIITAILLDFSERTRKEESSELMRSMTGKVLSLDATFRAASKATIVNSDGKRSTALSGGILSVINELSSTLAWRFCQTQSAHEIAEMLTPVAVRFKELGAPDPEMVIVDNCCTVRSRIIQVWPNTKVGLDVYHLIKRYTAVISGGFKNPNNRAIGSDITSAILKTRAADSDTGIAIYWSKDEQVSHLESVYRKWDQKGAWNANGASTHAEQMKHARKGCLSRTRQDIRSDGSRIEGSHKSWNGLQRSFASGIKVMTALGHDMILRRNVRLGINSPKNSTTLPLAFLQSTNGSHHIRLRHFIAQTYNSLVIQQNQRRARTGFPPLEISSQPQLTFAPTQEQFGLIKSEHALTFGGLFAFEVLDTPSSSDTLQLSSPLLSSGMEVETEIAFNTQLDDSNMVSASLFLTTHAAVRSSAAKATSSVIDINTGNIIASRTSEKRKAVETSNSTEISAENIPIEPPTTKRLKALDNGEQSKGKTSTVHPFFMKRAPPSPSPTATGSQVIKTTISATNSSLATLSVLTSPLLRPVEDKQPSLTGSQMLFASCTGINPKSLELIGDIEYHLFMDMRVEFQWVSYRMTPRRWADATEAYNGRLKIRSPSAVLKLPRALLHKLANIEKTVTDRILKNDFISRKSNSETFWKKHCLAVPLLKSDGNNLNAVNKRKPQTCGRCQTIMYPCSQNSPENHKKGFCSDGVSQSSKNIAWPQPPGIFAKGKQFDPLSFLRKMREVYEELIIQRHPLTELSMEGQAFADFAIAKIKESNGTLVFDLAYAEGLAIDESLPDTLFIIDDDGKKNYLRLDCLRD